MSPPTRRFLLLLVLPTLLPIFGVILPLVLGQETLFVRDIMGFFVPIKTVQAEALAEGRIPSIDLTRDGGQPALGNPNTLPLYPDNLFYLAGDPLWALNAHFWIHWLLCPWAFFWLGRAWGLGREASWVGGVFYATSGFFLSQLNLYNLIVIVALAPALVAATLEAAEGKRGRWPIVGLLWALVILAGDPFSALLILFLALTAPLCRAGFRPLLTHAPKAAIAFALGTLIAAPMIIDFLRIAPTSFRVQMSGVVAASLAESLHPARLLEVIFPLFYGPLELGYWGVQISNGDLPLQVSLAPGVLALGLFASTFGRGAFARSKGSFWSFLQIGLGLFLAFGAHNPIVEALYQLPMVGLLRYPMKFGLLVAVGFGFLVGLAIESWQHGKSKTRLSAAFGVLSLVFLGLALAFILQLQPLLEAISNLAGPALPPDLFSRELARWTTTAIIVFLVAGLGFLTVRFGGTTAASLVFLALLQVVSQLILLESLRTTDLAAIYRQKPDLVAALPANANIMSTSEQFLFGRNHEDVRQAFPDLRQHWLYRCLHEELTPAAGVAAGFRYTSNGSPDGLDSLYTGYFHRVLQNRSDEQRLRALEIAGVDILLLARPLDSPRVEEQTEFESSCRRKVKVFRLLKRSPDFQVVGRSVAAANLQSAIDQLLAADFDPATTAVVSRARNQAPYPNGQVLAVNDSLEEIKLEVEVPVAGVLVTTRAWLPLWRAEIDGQPATPMVVNVHHLGLDLPTAGRHHLRLFVDRRPTQVGFAVAGASLIGLLVWITRSFRRRPRAFNSSLLPR
jgi:hypothetical protein